MQHDLAHGERFVGRMRAVRYPGDGLPGDDQTAVVRVQAAYTKNRREVEQPLPAEVANVLRGYLAGRPADAPVWPGTWSNAASAKMIRRDLAEARKKWISFAQDARQRAEREQSDFLTYCNAAGLVADFHGLRHTFISRIVETGATPRLPRSWPGIAISG